VLAAPFARLVPRGRAARNAECRRRCGAEVAVCKRALPTASLGLLDQVQDFTGLSRGLQGLGDFLTTSELVEVIRGS